MAKILIFTSHGGGGHISASNAIIENLSVEHSITAAALFKDILKDLDPVRILTRNTMHCEDAYNYFLKKKWTRVLNLMCLLAIWTIPFTKKMISKKIVAYLNEYKPDLMISVIPIVNGILNDIARSHNIPLIIIPTDLDSSTFIHNINPQKSDLLFVGLAFEDHALLKIAHKANLYPNQYAITGFPLKKSFFSSKNILGLKTELSIPHDKPVIFLLMGAMGSEAIYNFTEILFQIKESFHLIICIGKNENLRKNLDALKKYPGISFTIVGFTDRIADFMAISDLCITKAGSVSVCEAIYMNKPLLLDCTAKSLLWEDFNINFIQNHEFGNPIKKVSELKNIVIKYLKNPDALRKTSHKMAKFKKNNFSLSISTTVRKMLNN